MAQSLVADYDSPSSDSEYESIITSKEESTTQLASPLEILNDDNTSISSSVFNNPYREAESYEQSILERHVKMTSIKESETTEPNKICYKFNKGKCKLEDKCQFIHHNPHITKHEINHSVTKDQSVTETNKKYVKRKIGLKNDLIPPKKFMKLYKKA